MKSVKLKRHAYKSVFAV